MNTILALKELGVRLAALSGARLGAFNDGIRDGLEQPDELTSGLTFDDETLRELYDEGVNLGQILGRLRRMSLAA